MKNPKKPMLYTAPLHKDGDKCPCCSSEKDTGGRLLLKLSRSINSRGNISFYLFCDKCKYKVTRTNTYENCIPPQNRSLFMIAVGESRKTKQSLDIAPFLQTRKLRMGSQSSAGHRRVHFQ